MVPGNGQGRLGSGTGRFSWHSQNNQRSMNNTMFVGDGIDRTIVTGHRNVPDGSTTSSPATFGGKFNLINYLFNYSIMIIYTYI